jgi:hypothetical protein
MDSKQNLCLPEKYVSGYILLLVLLAPPDYMRIVTTKEMPP